MIYLDNHSTTALDPLIFEVMKPYFLEKFANASHGIYRLSWETEAAVEKARAQVAAWIGAHEKEIIFTGSATESNHLAILGVLPQLQSMNRMQILSIRIEHSSVLGALELAEKKGAEVKWVRTHSDGRVDLDHLRTLMSNQTGLVSVATANHEIGTIQDVQKISKICREYGAFFHSDVVQAMGKIPVNVQESGIDLLTLSAHKVHGPKGVGALFIRRKNPRVELQAVFKGGSQERGLRPGTPNTPAIVGMGEAAELALKNQSVDSTRMKELRDQLWRELSSELDGLIRNGSSEHALPHNLNVSILGVDGAALFANLQGIAVSNASACVSGIQDYSQVLSELGVEPERARATLRFGLSKFNHLSEIKTAAQEVIKVVKLLRKMEQDFAAQSGVRNG